MNVFCLLKMNLRLNLCFYFTTYINYQNIILVTAKLLKKIFMEIIKQCNVYIFI
jgi:hypothetical protein